MVVRRTRHDAHRPNENEERKICQFDVSHSAVSRRKLLPTRAGGHGGRSGPRGRQHMAAPDEAGALDDQHQMLGQVLVALQGQGQDHEDLPVRRAPQQVPHFAAAESADALVPRVCRLSADRFHLRRYAARIATVYYGKGSDWGDTWWTLSQNASLARCVAGSALFSLCHPPPPAVAPARRRRWTSQRRCLLSRSSAFRLFRWIDEMCTAYDTVRSEATGALYFFSSVRTFTIGLFILMNNLFWFANVSIPAPPTAA